MAVEKQGLVAPLLNGRNLTNAGTFRAYCLEYLRANSSIHKEGMTFLVRQLAPTEKGLPIEIYVFVNDVQQNQLVDYNIELGINNDGDIATIIRFNRELVDSSQFIHAANALLLPCSIFE